jgi:hypothetical protein
MKTDQKKRREFERVLLCNKSCCPEAEFRRDSVMLLDDGVKICLRKSEAIRLAAEIQKRFK